jgi:hypothetical protein
MPEPKTQHAEEDVQGEEAADPQDRVALDGQQDQQHRPGHRGQPLVALSPAGVPGRPGAGLASRRDGRRSPVFGLGQLGRQRSSCRGGGITWRHQARRLDVCYATSWRMTNRPGQLILRSDALTTGRCNPESAGVVSVAGKGPLSAGQVCDEKTNVCEPLLTHRQAERWHQNRGIAEGKSFEIDKRLIVEAWEKVRASNGAPGVDAVG